MQTLTINIQNHALVEKVVWLLEHFKHDGLEIVSRREVTEKTALDHEIDKRIQEYHSGAKTSPLHTGLDDIRNELLAKI
jgi:hypothetical protein